jgi:hypothetical protein
MLKANDLRDALIVFWPTLATAVIVPLTIRYQLGWLGALILLAIMILRNFWWSCLFGLPNGIVLLGGAVMCTIAALARLM